MNPPEPFVPTKEVHFSNRFDLERLAHGNENDGSQLDTDRTDLKVEDAGDEAINHAEFNVVIIAVGGGWNSKTGYATVQPLYAPHYDKPTPQIKSCFEEGSIFQMNPVQGANPPKYHFTNAFGKGDLSYNNYSEWELRPLGPNGVQLWCPSADPGAEPEGIVLKYNPANEYGTSSLTTALNNLSEEVKLQDTLFVVKQVGVPFREIIFQLKYHYPLVPVLGKVFAPDTHVFPINYGSMSFIWRFSSQASPIFPQVAVTAMSDLHWTKEIFDCEDFAAVFKGRVSESVRMWNFNNGKTKSVGVFCGVVVGLMNGAGHAINFCVNGAGNVVFFEPQNGDIVSGPAWEPKLFFLF